MRATAEAAAFFGLADDRLVDPDAAVSQLEGIAAVLEDLEPNERQQFREFLRRLAESEQVNVAGSKRPDFSGAWQTASAYSLRYEVILRSKWGL